jgi:dipeptide/tripeptide permease
MMNRLIYFIDKVWNFVFSYTSIYLLIALLVFIFLNKKIYNKLKNYTDKKVKLKAAIITISIIIASCLMFVLIIDSWLSQQPF